VPCGTQDTVSLTLALSFTGLSPSMADLSMSVQLEQGNTTLRSYNPCHIAKAGLGYSPFARHYSGNLG
jgi:hypothetical protein